MYPTVLEILNRNDTAELRLYTNEMEPAQKCAVLMLDENTTIADGTGLTFEAALNECESETRRWLTL